MEQSYAKPLTKNDLGLTGAHQGGICVPKKNKELIDFFPQFDESEINPEAWIQCIDPKGRYWKMRYVYYNGKLHDTSTRNEYRITYMTAFFKEWNAGEGSSVVFKSTENPETFRIHIERPLETTKTTQNKFDFCAESTPTVVLKGWRRIH